jgi:flagellar hook-associated protein 1 FlgK
MSLFSSIRMAANAMQANQIGLQVVGQNIANANTPDYIREELILTPAPTQKIGNLLLGNGVQIEAVVQKIDLFLEERLRGSISQRSDAETEETAYSQLESLINELGENSIGSYLEQFASSISDVLNAPESVSTRNMAVLQATTVTEAINNLADGVSSLWSDTNDRVINMAADINRLTEDIRRLNIQISDTEGGNTTESDAVGLRDQRLADLQDLAELIDIKVQEQPSGSVVVYCGETYLVYEGYSQQVEAVIDSESGKPTADIQVVTTQASLNPAGGELRGLLDVRDKMLSGFGDGLDHFARNLIFEFNKVYSSGQGLTGYSSVTSESAVIDPAASVDSTGLPFTPTNGSFQVITRVKSTGLTTTSTINVDLDGLGPKTTVNDLITQLKGISGLDVSLNAENRLVIKADSGIEFSFGNDSSGALAAFGINTFFSGSNAANIGVSKVVTGDPAKFAASQSGIGKGTENAVVLADFLNLPVKSENGDTLSVLYNRLTADVTQSSSIAQSTAEGARTFEETLRAQKTAISGVSIDEETVQMMAYQRAFQASARFISVVSELFDVLVNI